MSRATSLKGLLGNLGFIIEWKTWAVVVVFALGVAAGAAWCLADVQVGEPRDGAERLNSGDGTAARAAGLARLLPDTAMGDAVRSASISTIGARSGRSPYGTPHVARVTWSAR